MNKAHAAKLKAHRDSYRELLDSAREAIAEAYEEWYDDYIRFHGSAVDEARLRRAWRPTGLQKLTRISESLGVHPNALAGIAKDFHLGDLWKGSSK